MPYLLRESVGLKQAFICKSKKLVATLALATALGNLRLPDKPAGAAIQAFHFLVDVRSQRPEKSCAAIADNPIV
jgi:hypothetical protein